MKKLAAVLLAMGLATSVSADSYRFKTYIKWCLHYKALMGLKQELVFIHYHHPDYCAWVSGPQVPGFDYPTLVGLSEPDWACKDVTPKELALHEMCHLRMHHLDITLPQMTDKEKHEEVRSCMKEYEKRDHEEE